eukprot:4508100-Karenia_brevis.AAC.1
MSGDWLFLYTGSTEIDEKWKSTTDKIKNSGVGIVLDKQMQAAWRKSGSISTYVSQRLMHIRLKFKGVWYTIFSIYAPTYQSRGEEKDEFYTLLDKAISE